MTNDVEEVDTIEDLELDFEEPDDEEVVEQDLGLDKTLDIEDDAEVVDDDDDDLDAPTPTARKVRDDDSDGDGDDDLDDDDDEEVEADLDAILKDRLAADENEDDDEDGSLAPAAKKDLPKSELRCSSCFLMVSASQLAKEPEQRCPHCGEIVEL